MRFQQTLGVDKLLLRGDRRRWRQLQSKSTEPSNNLVTGFYPAIFSFPQRYHIERGNQTCASSKVWHIFSSEV